MKELKNFPECRYKHCYSVGRKMYEYAKKILKWDENKCREMFVIGNLHDIGYEFTDDEFNKHALIIVDALGDYRYNKELKYHNEIQNICLTDEMKLLYYADLTVDGSGNWVSYEERLDDLINRHGENSKDVIESIKIINKLIEWGFNDKVQLKDKGA